MTHSLVTTSPHVIGHLRSWFFPMRPHSNAGVQYKRSLRRYAGQTTLLHHSKTTTSNEEKNQRRPNLPQPLTHNRYNAALTTQCPTNNSKQLISTIIFALKKPKAKDKSFSMEMTVKAFFQKSDSSVEVRRIPMTAEGGVVDGLFATLHAQLVSRFPELSNKMFTVSWKDSDGDLVMMSSDDELHEALTSTKGQTLKVYVKESGEASNNQIVTGTDQTTKAEQSGQVAEADHSPSRKGCRGGETTDKGPGCYRKVKAAELRSQVPPKHRRWAKRYIRQWRQENIESATSTSSSDGSDVEKSSKVTMERANVPTVYAEWLDTILPRMHQRWAGQHPGKFQDEFDKVRGAVPMEFRRWCRWHLRRKFGPKDLSESMTESDAEDKKCHRSRRSSEFTAKSDAGEKKCHRNHRSEESAAESDSGHKKCHRFRKSVELEADSGATGAKCHGNRKCAEPAEDSDDKIGRKNRRCVTFLTKLQPAGSADAGDRENVRSAKSERAESGGDGENKTCPRGCWSSMDKKELRTLQKKLKGDVPLEYRIWTKKFVRQWRRDHLTSGDEHLHDVSSSSESEAAERETISEEIVVPTDYEKWLRKFINWRHIKMGVPLAVADDKVATGCIGQFKDTVPLEYRRWVKCYIFRRFNTAWKNNNSGDRNNSNDSNNINTTTRDNSKIGCRSQRRPGFARDFDLGLMLASGGPWLPWLQALHEKWLELQARVDTNRAGQTVTCDLGDQEVKDGKRDEGNGSPAETTRKEKMVSVEVSDGQAGQQELDRQGESGNRVESDSEDQGKKQRKQLRRAFRQLAKEAKSVMMSLPPESQGATSSDDTDEDQDIHDIPPQVLNKMIKMLTRMQKRESRREEMKKVKNDKTADQKKVYTFRYV
ncbi:sequestosome-1-like [Plakobranchus ocellatus]|uniref:Sequestosome-1-like n=1 Tax=Plakobranchus ocellatus TaxID=259542 RepID=A0AAV3Z664_9GAST|nr:sequestosome-1-like [Plakobranchus ocellatus]